MILIHINKGQMSTPPSNPTSPEFVKFVLWYRLLLPFRLVTWNVRLGSCTQKSLMYDGRYSFLSFTGRIVVSPPFKPSFLI